MEKFILGSQNTASKYIRPTQVLVVLLSGMNLYCVAIGVARGGGQGARPPPIEILSMIKMPQKDYCFFSFSFF